MKPPPSTPLSEVITTIIGSFIACGLMVGLPYIAKEWRYDDLRKTSAELIKDRETKTCPPPHGGQVTGCELNRENKNKRQ